MCRYAIRGSAIDGEILGYNWFESLVSELRALALSYACSTHNLPYLA